LCSLAAQNGNNGYVGEKGQQTPMILNVSIDLPGDGAFLRIARRVGRGMLEDLNVTEQDVSDIEFVVGELCSNVIRHAKVSNGRFQVVLEYHADKVVIYVKDTGVGFSFKDVQGVGTERPDRDGQTRLGGFGLDMVRLMSDHLEFTRSDKHGTTVEAVKALHYKTPASAVEAEQLDRADGAVMTMTGE